MARPTFARPQDIGFDPEQLNAVLERRLEEAHTPSER